MKNATTITRYIEKVYSDEFNGLFLLTGHLISVNIYWNPRKILNSKYSI